jgi:glycosyltransferase involved in cell wall biosynthesis
MKELYAKASIFCQPSFFENSSIVLLEAMQSGCTILARNV